ERHAELDHARAGRGARGEHLDRGRGIGVAEGEIRDEHRAAIARGLVEHGAQRGAARGAIESGPRALRWAMVTMSLSPRPDSPTMIALSGPVIFATPSSAAIAWAVSSAHRMPSV